MEYNSCKLCGKFSTPIPESNVTVKTRRKREVSVTFVADQDVAFENDVVKMSGKLTKLPEGETNGTKIPHFKFKFNAKIKSRFSNQNITIPIDVRNPNSNRNIPTEEKKEIGKENVCLRLEKNRFKSFETVCMYVFFEKVIVFEI
jgi:hypothetical protein